REGAPLDHGGRLAVSGAAQLHDPLRDQIHVFGDAGVELVEQLVESDEARPFDVPVGVLDLEHQVDAIPEPPTEELVDLRANRYGQVIPRIVHRRRLRLWHLALKRKRHRETSFRGGIPAAHSQRRQRGCRRDDYLTLNVPFMAGWSVQM